MIIFNKPFKLPFLVKSFLNQLKTLQWLKVYFVKMISLSNCCSNKKKTFN